MSSNEHKKGQLPMLTSMQLFLMTFGYAGVQVAFSVQTGNMGRIFQTLGSDPTKLGFFFILPPLAGMITQPLIGLFSDKTWLPKLGRRMPYLIGGCLVSLIVLLLLPNTGSFGFGYGSMTALWFGAVTVLFMDLSANVSMQPFKMIIPDMVNEKQTDKAWSLQNIWGSLGGVIAFVFPFILTSFGVANTAARGVVPDSVKISFYVAAAILLLSTIFTIINVKEYDPETLAYYHGFRSDDKTHESFIDILKHAPKVFWTLGIVEFFVWFGIPYMWTYSTGALSENIWHVSDPASAGYQAAGNWFGILQAVYSVVAIVVGILFQRLNDKTRKMTYFLSLIAGGLGFIIVAYGHTHVSSLIGFVLIGIGWIALISIPFTILTNALDGKHDGVYLGLFNCFICIPQIVASVASFAIFPAVGKSMAHMLAIAGVFLMIGGCLIWIVKEEKTQVDMTQKGE
ncbi:MAG: SLC45 family MFS transporter [Leuconostoc mesenteroides]|jgi:maltose/moltooligosaccharide transporter|uniref:Permease of the major facilitator superfamily n=1 Tax=Leuconostoc mesenteroides subsp. mesenteroides (strain ATCC 8293 / DSM 20343 / BCRC 11652 / CCM 1803 / JCM 6124 / NCDO 523 / NBRC 100496 / NCIMB 8023 / NCTC 12954 / NRRL B-1118 / 37Y) TaxID=203120 RepID=Q03XR7_LEUMM|nr:SLC45 family MFS transporter [Leuconostoc mesenteroides]ABJ62005.1 permease of the major facilitator superfamily [Leuconostoc mesenteroides subsp. mesenteroides ATCC 8293]KAA8369159.1 SLC45 family MFS transporter [Leuconostoc mesenteroides]MCH3934261.1 SLC45 family MFS transporter [Leuconostoc mesenteroides]MCI1877760.1 SLC45 family MFS transporter [Leuconostoc mesenteroides]MCI1907301.1 SLC45 family MFS transporter [Leuconostoc mesenteroides]